jgi:rare lipoprotein A (peptidoglycan hydrolase)
MVTRRKFGKLNAKTPFQMWFVAGTSSVALAAVVMLFATGTVQADVRLFHPTITASPPAASPTPATLTLQEKAEERGDKLQGVASWYGGKFNGRRTASGEVYNMYAMTACHPTLPFGTIVRVVDRASHRSVVVRINDRGYLYDHRIMDLSYGAAKRLKMVRPGLAEVELHVLSLGKTEDRK